MEQSSTPIDSNDLLVFAHVAQLGSVSRAAQRLGWPKSTVSRRLAALETQMGERLLLRTTRRQTLTEFGQQLLEHAQQVAQEVDAAQALREHRQSAPSGRLRVSMPSDFANLLLLLSRCIRPLRWSWTCRRGASICWARASIWPSAWAICPMMACSARDA